GSTDLIKVEVVRAILGKGTGVGQGIASGVARVTTEPADVKNFNQREILVVNHTNAGFLDVMKKCAGIITEEDSLTSHAAIIGLKLGIPVLVGVKDATKVIKDRAILTIDTQKGIVYSGAESNSTNLI
ncbi:MAG: PEP-utilizing enzyme, partial [Microcoleaceae cyanobacterium]